ncbi:MAG: hypothetical protein JO021_09400 [Alphaproteobacteria bacterium]|nr:hypothetical protein [Alphaproteobacteria bacterium]
MRKILLALVAVTALGWAGAAFAQSHQGGYLGQNPSPQTATAVPRPPDVGSRQGGYLGLNPGANLAPARAPEGSAAWCVNSPEPSRCRARAAVEHEICAARPSSESYAHCRRAVDQMHGQ